MPSLARGQKIRLADLTPSLQLRAGLSAQAPGVTFDFSCFGVDASDKLSDDRYFVFFNQKSSPEGALKQSGGQNGDSETFEIDLSRLPATIRKLVFVMTIDGSGTLAQLARGHFRLLANGGEVARFDFAGKDFGAEKAIIAAEIYFKEVWRVAAVGQGFSGGLSALLKYFGGEEIEETESPPPLPPPPPPIPVAPPKVSLDKDQQLQVKLQKEAPQLVNLSKVLAVSLRKNNLQDVVARVALVLDASGSMTKQYSGGNVQAVVERIATLAMRLDDDGELDVWGFAARHRKQEAATLQNINGYVSKMTTGGSYMSIIKGLGGTNNEPPVMREVLDFYRGSTLPAFIVFISDGGVGSGTEIKKVLVEASSHPIFWQFVGLGGSNYGILQDLDTMQGRVVDNANFFHVDDLKRIDDETLYNRLLGEFPAWLQEARAKRILR
jgi:stress response protein SCP2